jgi:hypothetical protein
MFTAFILISESQVSEGNQTKRKIKQEHHKSQQKNSSLLMKRLNMVLPNKLMKLSRHQQSLNQSQNQSLNQ